MFAKFKNCYKSVVIWFNAIAISLLSFADLIHSSLPELSGYLPENLYKQIGLAALIGNLVLRFKTSVGLEDK